MLDAGKLVLSVVSHGQKDLVLCLLDDLKLHLRTRFKLIVTENIPESFDVAPKNYPFPIEIVRNVRAKGFAANHNAAFRRCAGNLFCVLNPDIQFQSDPFPELIALAYKPKVGVVGPVVLGSELSLQDHAREFPSFFSLAAKSLGWDSLSAPPSGKGVFYPDWIAGMFMLFRSETFRSVGGFDEKYFLYYEDVDICARLRASGLEVAVCTGVSVIHDARRESWSNPTYLWWHLRSAMRFLASRSAIARGLNRRSYR